MPGNRLIFQSAEAARDAITNDANIKIQKLYESWADELQTRAEYYGRKTASSYGLKRLNTLQLQEQMKETARRISKEVEGVAKNSIYLVASSVIEANNDWLKKLGFPAEGAFASIPDQTVRRLVTGQIYQGGWNLSSAIWGDNQDTLAKLYELTAKGLAQNMSVYDISKMLEQYVSPNRKLPWNLTMPDGKKIYRKQVDYNAQRLVRTLTQHGYQTSFIAVTEKNPFITKVIWRANGSRVCPLCLSRDGKEFNKNEVPMDHPNGMCTMEPKVADNLEDKLADWVNSPDGTFPEIDEFAKEFGYVPEVKVNMGSSFNGVVNGNDISSTWKRRPDEFDFEIDDVLSAQGFDGVPKLASAEEFEKYVNEANGGNGFIAQRAYSAPDQETLDLYRNQLYSGKWYVDCSVGGGRHGQGMYCVADYRGNITDAMESEIIGYSTMYGVRPSYVETFTVDKSAIFIDEDIIKKEMSKYNSGILSKSYKKAIDETLTKDNVNQTILKYKKYFNVEMSQNEMATYLKGIQIKNAMPSEYGGQIKKQTQQVIKKYKLKDHSLAESQFRNMNAYKNASKFQYSDLGSFAAAKGYDGIKVSGREGEVPYVNILNRTKCIFLNGG